LASLLRRKDLLKSTNAVIRNIFHIIRCNGLTTTVLYLKESQRITYHWMAGNPIHKCEEGPFVGISKFGLPTIIKPLYMSFIKGDKVAMQMTLFILSLYRIFVIPGKLKLDTITDLSVYKIRPITSEAHRALEDAKEFSSTFKSWLPKASIKMAWPFFTSTKTPSGLSAFLSIPASIRALLLPENLMILSHILYVNWKTKSCILFFFLYFTIGIVKLHNTLLSILLFLRIDPYKGWFYNHFFIGWLTPSIGKLAEKEEAAGKIRVFAMVDPITQWTLKPFHDYFFKLLSSFEFDATKDQIEKAKAFSIKNRGKPMFSIDISAATDRIPMELYVVMLEPILGPSLVESWKEILISRTYYHHKTKQHLSYGAGQPMGALSSWASLALVHHFLVLLAAYRCNYRVQFKDYIILGDDLVIANKEVADAYLVLVASMGIGINMSKTLVSDIGVMEFAKRIWYNGKIYSGIPPRDAFLAFRHPVMLPNFIRGIARDVDCLPASHSIKFLIEHFGVRYDPYRRIVSLPKSLLGSIVEMIGHNSIYRSKYTPDLLLSLSRSRLIDLDRWFKGSAHQTTNKLLQFILLDDALFREYKRVSGSPFSWILRLKSEANDSGIRISTLYSYIMILFGFLIEIKDYIKYTVKHLFFSLSERPPEPGDGRVHSGSGTYVDESFVDSTKIMVDPVVIPNRITMDRGVQYYVYSLDPLHRSPLSKVNLTFLQEDLTNKEVKEAYIGARAKAKFIKSLGRPYLQLPAGPSL